MPPPFLFRFPPVRSSLNLHKLTISVSFSTSTPKISVFDYLLNHCNLSPECASKVSSSSTADLRINPKNADSVLNFFKESGFSNIQIEAMVRKHPKVLSYKVETIEPKINVLKEIGFMPSDLAGAISASPWHLKRSVKWLRQCVLALQNAFGPNADICGFVKNSATRRGVLEKNLDRMLIPNVDYLKSRGICPIQIAKHVCKSPTVYCSNPKKFKDTVERINEMGFHRESKMFLYALRVRSKMSENSWKLKLKLFRELGFPKHNILHAFRISPIAFSLSERKIKETTQLLLTVVDISYIASNPQLLHFSVEMRLKPRLRLLKTLELRNLLIKRPALTSFLKMSDAKFINKYVSPYSDEIQDLYEAAIRSKATDSALLTENS